MPEPLEKMFTLRNSHRLNPLWTTGVDVKHTEARNLLTL